MGTSVLVGFAITIAVLIGNAVISYRSTNTLIRNQRAVAHTLETLSEIEAILSTVKDAETGARGYVIAADESFLEPYDNAIKELPAHLARLRELVSDNPAQIARLDAMNVKIDQKLSTMADGLATFRADGFDLESARARARLGVSKRLMDEVRTLDAEMADTERGLLRTRNAESEVSGRNALATLAIANGLTLGLVALVFVFIRRDARTRALAENALRAANEELEARVAERTADLSRANRELELSNRELQDFAFVASHDLQEPLRKIQAFGDRLKTKQAERLDESGRDYIDRMQGAASRMHALLNDLLAYSRVTSKGAPFASIDLTLTARDAISDLEIRIQDSGGSVDLGELPHVDADVVQMRQLFQNLVANALKFRAPGVAPVVNVRGSVSGETARIEVADNGIGFDEKYLDKIFSPFQRLHARQTYEGTGMGLAVCRKIVERHHGRITARSKPDEGATFIIELPVSQPRSQGEPD